MLTRRALTCLRLSRVNHLSSSTRRIRHGSIQRRCLNTSGPAPVAAPKPSTLSPLAAITSDLDELAPRFDIDAESIEIIRGPVEFYEILKAKISSAKKRIYLSTLYFGAAEHELIATIRDALKANPDLRISILTDALRGTREAPKPTCASLLAPLVEEFGTESVELCVFHTPNLTGVKKAILPKRINEGWGLQHMKLYGIDDEIIISGANLSSDYFTNRQDRYHVFKSKELTDYFQAIYNTVCKLSYRVSPSEAPEGFALEWPATNLQPSPLQDPKGYISAATQALAPLLKPTARPLPSSSSKEKTDTQIYPLLQLSPILDPDTSTELPALTGILHALSQPPLIGSKWTFTAGYFNMTPLFRQLLLSSKPSSATIVAASPWANGFYGSKGVSGMLPAGYTYLSRSFLDAVARAGLSDRIAVKEWRRGTVNTPGGWSYHAKGIWITLPSAQDGSSDGEGSERSERGSDSDSKQDGAGKPEEGPSISLVGSSNYTKRSYGLDLEANALIVTSNADLKRRLGEEEKWLQEFATVMSRDDYARTERRVGLHVRVAMWIVTLVGGGAVILRSVLGTCMSS